MLVRILKKLFMVGLTMSKVEKVYYLMVLLMDLAVNFLMGTYMVYLMAKGMNLFDCHLINFAMWVALLVFEIPTGLIADVFGRKVSVILSNLIKGVSFLIYASANSFWGFILGEVVYQFGSTFSSGAFESWMMDAVEKKERERIVRNAEKIAKITGMVGAGLGGWMMDFSLGLPWICGGITCFVAAIIGWWLMDEKPEFTKRKSGILKNFLKYGRESLIFIKTDKAYRFMVFIGFIQAIALHVANMQWQILFTHWLDRKIWFGLLFSLISISLFAGIHISGYWLRGMSDKKRLIICQMVIGLLIWLTVLMKSVWLVLLFFCLHEVFRGVYNPIYIVYQNEVIPEENNHIRATLISCQKMGDSIGRIIGVLVGGVIIQWYGIYCSWTFAGLVLIVFGVIFLLNGHLGTLIKKRV